jgi:hypothetical protein
MRPVASYYGHSSSKSPVRDHEGYFYWYGSGLAPSSGALASALDPAVGKSEVQEPKARELEAQELEARAAKLQKSEQQAERARNLEAPLWELEARGAAAPRELEARELEAQAAKVRELEESNRALRALAERARRELLVETAQREFFEHATTKKNAALMGDIAARRELGAAAQQERREATDAAIRRLKSQI